jgi:hypothetical protein
MSLGSAAGRAFRLDDRRKLNDWDRLVGRLLIERAITVHAAKNDRPRQELALDEIRLFVDQFEAYMKQRQDFLKGLDRRADASLAVAPIELRRARIEVARSWISATARDLKSEDPRTWYCRELLDRGFARERIGARIAGCERHFVGVHGGGFKVFKLSLSLLPWPGGRSMCIEDPERALDCRAADSFSRAVETAFRRTQAYLAHQPAHWLGVWSVDMLKPPGDAKPWYVHDQSVGGEALLGWTHLWSRLMGRNAPALDRMMLVKLGDDGQIGRVDMPREKVAEMCRAGSAAIHEVMICGLADATNVAARLKAERPSRALSVVAVDEATGRLVRPSSRAGTPAREGAPPPSRRAPDARELLFAIDAWDARKRRRRLARVGAAATAVMAVAIGAVAAGRSLGRRGADAGDGARAVVADLPVAPAARAAPPPPPPAGPGAPRDRAPGAGAVVDPPASAPPPPVGGGAAAVSRGARPARGGGDRKGPARADHRRGDGGSTPAPAPDETRPAAPIAAAPKIIAPAPGPAHPGWVQPKLDEASATKAGGGPP